MTNAEKFLKDGVKTRDFIDNMFSSQYPEEFEETLYIDKASIICWLNNPAKPQLTEDERVILRNIPTNIYSKIYRDCDGCLSVAGEEGYNGLFIYNHLFQFIKNGEEYSIEELLKGE